MRRDSIDSAIRALLNRRSPRSRRTGGRRGMSLVEVMVVIAIILTLMSVIGYGVMSVFQSSRVDTTKLQMTRVAERIQIYSLRHKGVPGSSDGLGAVYDGEEVPQDSWGNEFRYVSPGPNGRDFDLISLGADGREGGSGNNADLKFSELN